MGYRRQQQAKEARLWLGQVIIPIFSTVGMLLANDRIRESLSEFADTVLKKKAKKSREEK